MTSGLGAPLARAPRQPCCAPQSSSPLSPSSPVVSPGGQVAQPLLPRPLQSSLPSLQGRPVPRPSSVCSPSSLALPAHPPSTAAARGLTASSGPPPASFPGPDRPPPPAFWQSGLPITCPPPACLCFLHGRKRHGSSQLFLPSPLSVLWAGAAQLCPPGLRAAPGCPALGPTQCLAPGGFENRAEQVSTSARWHPQVPGALRRWGELHPADTKAAPGATALGLEVGRSTAC